MEKIRARLIVKGVVQGVNFRHYTQRQAQIHNVTGWVMNRPDGTVAALLEGKREDVEAMIDWCRHGPPAARVTELVAQCEEYKGEFQSFVVQYGAGD